MATENYASLGVMFSVAALTRSEGQMTYPMVEDDFPFPKVCSWLVLTFPPEKTHLDVEQGSETNSSYATEIYEMHHTKLFFEATAFGKSRHVWGYPFVKFREFLYITPRRL